MHIKNKTSELKNKNNYLISKILPFYKKKILKKPDWLKVKIPINIKVARKIKKLLHKNQLNSVCEEALCPNLIECFNRGTATFMILGDICTRKCPFCAVKKGKPNIIDPNEPYRLSQVISNLNLKYVVLTSVNRDDLKDGGAQHFYECILEIRKKKKIKIEILVPDFRKKQKIALNIISKSPPDIFNHNIENVPRLYSLIRPGANYENSLKLLEMFNKICPKIPIKSGLMLGLGEKKKEILSVLKDLKSVGVTIITMGQYMQPSKNHLLVQKYLKPSEFLELQELAYSYGFKRVFCAPLVRSSYHADLNII